jgi:hypothetical protein
MHQTAVKLVAAISAINIKKGLVLANPFKKPEKSGLTYF